MVKFFGISIITFALFISATYISSAEINFEKKNNIEDKVFIELAGGRLFIGMTKKEAFDVEGVPYRVRRIQGEDNKEMWIYRCNNEDGFNEDCLYLYFDGDTLDKIERP